ncbi:TonB-dependent receptor domain-containing protein [Neisseria sp. Ec49-e6-T10]|uniref:TonB-dependent receptor domain-containing protein n=1 Tax=Neisseria sp. Ec49-e6-T10 TaxID=3140744 RepID=UPI003EB75D0E
MNQLSVLSLSLLLPTGFVFAQSTTSTTTTLDNNDVIVTATRTAQKVSNALSDVSVITQSDIQNSGSRSVSDLLNKVTGVETFSSGGRGKATNLFLRGTSSEQSIVLVDGVRLFSATTGSAAIQHIPLEQIDRIEVVRGSTSSIYGADAIGGVIQIFTKKPSNTHTQSASIGIGSQNTYEASAGASGKWNKLGYQAMVSHDYTGGFSTTNKDASAYVYNPDNDGYRNTTFTGKLDYEWLKGQTIKASAYIGKSKSEYDAYKFSMAYPPIPADYKQDEEHSKLTQFTVESSNTLIDEHLFSSLKYSKSQDKSKSFESERPDNTGFFNTTTDNVSWILNGKINTINAIFGLDWLRSKVDSSTIYEKDSRDNKAVFIGADWQYKNHLLEGSARYDDNEQFGSARTGRIAYGYKFTPTLSARASYATGFRAPTFNQLYYPGWSNPDLKPEKSHNTEIGLTYHPEKLKIDWVAFRNSIDNLIQYQNNHTVTNNKVKIKGTSLSVAASLSDSVILKANATYQDPIDKNTNQVLNRRSRAFGNIGVDYLPNEDWTLNANVYIKGKGYDSYSDDMTWQTVSVRNAGYATLDLGVRYQMTPSISTSFTVENLFDKGYTNAYGYNTSGQSVFWRISYQN